MSGQPTDPLGDKSRPGAFALAVTKQRYAAQQSSVRIEPLSGQQYVATACDAPLSLLVSRRQPAQLAAIGRAAPKHDDKLIVPLALGSGIRDRNN